MVRQQLSVQRDLPVRLDVVAVQENGIGTAGEQALRAALEEKLPKLERLFLSDNWVSHHVLLV